MLRVASIAFLNPAPLLYDFEHEPRASQLRENYTLHYTSPAQCATELHEGRADLGLIPIASLTSDLAIVPGCTIASLDEVRSILLLVKNPDHRDERRTKQVRTLAADAASRSSQAYAHILFRHFLDTHPATHEAPADPLEMLATADAALLIGDPALLAREPPEIDASMPPPTPRSSGSTLPRSGAGTPACPGLPPSGPSAPKPSRTQPQLTADLNASRDNGLRHIDQIVEEWTPRIAIPAETIRTYLTHNIHYTLDPGCIESIHLFRTLAAEIDLLPPLRTLRML